MKRSSIVAVALGLRLAATRPRAMFAVLCALVAVAAPAAAEKIKEIDVVENTKTTDETVILIADVEVGDTVTVHFVRDGKKQSAKVELSGAAE